MQEELKKKTSMYSTQSTLLTMRVVRLNKAFKNPRVFQKKKCSDSYSQAVKDAAFGSFLLWLHEMRINF